MLEFTTVELTLEQEAIVRAAELEIDTLAPEELRVCLKLATRSDLIKTSIIYQLTQQASPHKKWRTQIVRRVGSNSKKLVGKL
ncbi:MAG TPA: hypothetical protein V6D03_04690 [Candidatus Caenarcaniphilales bacterium]